jgi:hypothetical protein
MYNIIAMPAQLMWLIGIFIYLLAWQQSNQELSELNDWDTDEVID